MAYLQALVGSLVDIIVICNVYEEELGALMRVHSVHALLPFTSLAVREMLCGDRVVVAQSTQL